MGLFGKNNKKIEEYEQKRIEEEQKRIEDEQKRIEDEQKKRISETIFLKEIEELENKFNIKEKQELHQKLTREINEFEIAKEKIKMKFLGYDETG